MSSTFTINQAGSATLQPGDICRWLTANGVVAQLQIRNDSDKYDLGLSVMGSPTAGITVTVNGQSVPDSNGMFTVSKEQTYQVMGNFSGAIVTIQNTTAGQAVSCMVNAI